MNKLYKINPSDNVAVALESVSSGEIIDDLKIIDDIPTGHKVLLSDLKCGDNVIKYGNPIGHTTCDIKKGTHIHSHNLATNLSDKIEYTYTQDNKYEYNNTDLTFKGYVREGGRVGTRNEIWIISTVGCVNNTVRMLEKEVQKMNLNECDGVFAYTHPYGCSQMGDDQECTRKVLSALINHSNAGGVLVVSLGCENSNINELKKYLGNINPDRVKFLVTQDCDDEIECGKELIMELYSYAKKFKRQTVSADNLVVGLKCGGSDAFSGITANSLCGEFTDIFTSFGASVLLTETPEMFGAEHLLMKRTLNKTVFDKTVNLINDFKDYFAKHNQVCYENPSPGNHDGGITTLEEKSLGCIQKGGNAVITDVLQYAERINQKGLVLLNGSGNDILSTTNLVCSGANLILFTTGRGTPLGAPVPTIKISSNTDLYKRKPNWIDFDAQSNHSAKKLVDYVLDVASGNLTCNEKNGCKEIAIFKSGVTL